MYSMYDRMHYSHIADFETRLKHFSNTIRAQENYAKNAFHDTVGVSGTDDQKKKLLAHNLPHHIYDLT